MGYRLNCGIELTDCEPGDSFISEGHPDKLLYCGGRTYFDIEGQSKYMICQDGKEWLISRLTPTEETKRKVEARRIHAAGFTDIEHTESGAIKCRQAGREYLIPNKPMKIKEDKLDIPEFKLFGWPSKQAYDDRIDELFGKRKPQDVPEIIPPLARIVDWRGGEEVKIGDVAILKQEKDANYKVTLEQDMSKSFFKILHGGVLDKSDVVAIIRINTAAIPKQQAMTKAEVEREFGAKVVD